MRHTLQVQVKPKASGKLATPRGHKPSCPTPAPTPIGQNWILEGEGQRLVDGVYVGISTLGGPQTCWQMCSVAGFTDPFCFSENALTGVCTCSQAW